MKRAVVTTSTSCLDYLSKPPNVFILPMNIHINDEDFLDGKTISAEQVRRYMLSEFPPTIRTSAPDEGQIIEFFYDLLNKGINEVLVITLSSRISATFQNLYSIRFLFGEKLKIHLYDSRSVSHGETVLVYEAAKMLNAGEDMERVVLRLNKIRRATSMYFTIDNVNTMIKTKRLSAPAGFFANIFGIKPIVTVNESGSIFALEKIRGAQHSLDRLAELIYSDAYHKKGYVYTMANHNNPYLDGLRDALATVGCTDVKNFPVASVCVANIGPNSIGAVFVERV